MFRSRAVYCQNSAWEEGAGGRRLTIKLVFTSAFFFFFIFFFFFPRHSAVPWERRAARDQNQQRGEVTQHLHELHKDGFLLAVRGCPPCGTPRCPPSTVLAAQAPCPQHWDPDEAACGQLGAGGTQPCGGTRVSGDQEALEQPNPNGVSGRWHQLKPRDKQTAS